MKKKVSIIVISIIIIISGILILNNKKEIEKEDNVLYINGEEIKNNGLGVYIKNELGTYTYATKIPEKASGYVFNPYESVCEGNTKIGWDNKKWGAIISDIEKENIKCYLYFLKDEKPRNDFEFYIGGEENPEYTNTPNTTVYISWKDNDIKDYCILEEDKIEECEWKSVVEENSIMLMDLNYSIEEDYELDKEDGEKK